MTDLGRITEGVPWRVSENGSKASKLRRLACRRSGRLFDTGPNITIEFNHVCNNLESAIVCVCVAQQARQRITHNQSKVLVVGDGMVELRHGCSLTGAPNPRFTLGLLAMPLGAYFILLGECP